MATINLGSIKFNWKGAYSGATAYVVDDVVESGGNSYVCILASTGNTPPNATYWELMAQAGTNGTDGTDLTTTLTTQGDIVYRDASGLARLGAGTSGQALVTQGTGANPIWSSVGGTNTPMWLVRKNTDQSINNIATTTITWQVEDVDTDNAFASNAFTVPSGKAGKYYVFGQMRIDTASDYEADVIAIHVNGTVVASHWQRHEYYECSTIDYILDLSVGDVVTLTAYQASGGSTNVGATDRGSSSWFGGYRLLT